MSVSFLLSCSVRAQRNPVNPVGSFPKETVRIGQCLNYLMIDTYTLWYSLFINTREVYTRIRPEGEEGTN